VKKIHDGLRTFYLETKPRRRTEWNCHICKRQCEIVSYVNTRKRDCDPWPSYWKETRLSKLVTKIRLWIFGDNDDEDEMDNGR